MVLVSSSFRSLFFCWDHQKCDLSSSFFDCLSGGGRGEKGKERAFPSLVLPSSPARIAYQSDERKKKAKKPEWKEENLGNEVMRKHRSKQTINIARKNIPSCKVSPPAQKISPLFAKKGFQFLLSSPASALPFLSLPPFLLSLSNQLCLVFARPELQLMREEGKGEDL